MITELRLENWKSFGEATLYIDPLSILIGTNASGKSNVLDALVFLQNVALGKTFGEALSVVRGGTDWLARNKNKYFCIDVTIVNATKKYAYQIRCFPETGVLIESLSSIKESDIVFTHDMSSPSVSVLIVEETLKRYADLEDFKELLKMVKSNLSSIFVFNPKMEKMINYSSIATQIKTDASNIAGVLAALSSERQKEVEEILTQYASRLPESEIQRVYAEKVGKLGKDAMLYCDEKCGESGESSEVFTVDARAMSDGTLRFLAILTALLTLPEGSLLAIDEVDNGLHPSRANLLLEALYEIGKKRIIDVLITTHNSALLDALGTTFIPFITVAHRDSQTGESKLTLLEDINRLPKLLAQGTVGKLAARGLLEKSLESQYE